jgi:dipeptidyl aminopeptidase/acylaminoacyl peptidase
LYVDENAILQGLPFDATHLEARGPAFPLLEGIESFDISRTGTLICKRSSPKRRTLQWLDKTGKTEAILETPASYAAPRVSPDGKRLAYTVHGDKGRQVWIYDLVRHVASQLTLESTIATNPLWMSGGNYLLFRGSDGIFVVAANGSSKPKLILKLNTIDEVFPKRLLLMAADWLWSERARTLNAISGWFH